MTNEKINILMTGGGAPGAAGIIKCLQAIPSFNVIVADANPSAVGRYLVNEFVCIPFAHEPLFAEKLINLCREKQIRLLLPLVTKELIPLSKRINDFASAGTRLLLSPEASLEIANNKSRLYEFLQWRGVDIPDFRVVETVEQFKVAVHELGYPEKMVCFKPSISNGSRGFRIITNLKNELDLLFNYKPDSTYIRFEEAIKILSSGHFPELLVSEYLPGEEFSVDCLCNHGKAELLLPRVRKKMINGITVEGEFIQEESIISYCTRIIKELQLHGNIGIQVKKSVHGKYLLLEINPRVQGTICAALGAGVNLPALAVKQELGLSVSANETEIKWGTRFSRYWQEVFY